MAIKPCPVKNCSKPSKARGLCLRHYNKWRNNGDPLFERETIQSRGTKWCAACGEYLPVTDFYKIKGDHRNINQKYSAYCIAHTKERAAQEYLERRFEVLTRMGSSCIQCGFDDWRALQIDHIHGGGTAEFKILHPGSRAYFAKVLANPNDYQLLCANCNTIKKIENGEVRRTFLTRGVGAR
jgi:hypothetical protein